MTVLLCHVATTKPQKEATMHISPPLNWAHPQLTRQTPNPNDKLEFPAQAQTSEIHPKLKVFLFPKAQVGSLSMWELLTVSSLLPVLVSGCSAWDPMPTPSQLQPCQDAVLSSLLSWLQGVPRCTQMTPHRIQENPQLEQLGKHQAQVLCCLGSLFQHMSPGRTHTLHSSCLFQAVAHGDCQRLFPIFILPTKRWFFH